MFFALTISSKRVASFSSLDCLHGFWQPLPHHSNLLRVLNNANPQTTVLVSQDDPDLQGAGALHRIETTLAEDLGVLLE